MHKAIQVSSMPGQPNKLSQFWQELKRRRVVNVIIVYASASFVLIELVNNITEPLGLPERLPGIVIIALLIGLPICLILSWIFDITPEGIEKTKPIEEQKEDARVETSGSWRIATYVSVVIITGLILFNILRDHPAKQSQEVYGKSIAVLPFINDSPDPENAYFINGTMEAILDHLSKIKDLRVVSRTSAEVYRDNPKLIPAVANEMKVSYILEGNMQKYGNAIRLNMQLIDAGDNHLWSKPYNREIEQIEDLLTLQSEIAQLVAAEIRVIITPEEKLLIEKVPTRSLSAYDFYQRGLNEFKKYQSVLRNMEVLDNAEDFYKLALEEDPSYAKAYSGLAEIYWQRRYWTEYFSEKSLDSVLILSEFALSFDNQLAEAFNLKGRYYQHIGKTKRALEEFNNAIRFNPNDWQAYFEKGNVVEDYVVKIESYHQAAIRCQDETLLRILHALGLAYLEYGFVDQTRHYFQEGYILGRDSAYLFGSRAWLEFITGSYDSAVYYLEETLKQDSGYLGFLGYHEFYIQAGQYKKAYETYKTLIEREGESQFLQLHNAHRIAFAFWKAGDLEGAEYYFNLQKEYCLESIRLNREYARTGNAYYDLAAVYAFQNDRMKAYTYLDEYSKRTVIKYWVFVNLKNDILFEGLREEERFQNILSDFEAEYQAEFRRISEQLEEKGLL